VLLVARNPSRMSRELVAYNCEIAPKAVRQLGRTLEYSISRRDPTKPRGISDDTVTRTLACKNPVLDHHGFRLPTAKVSTGTKTNLAGLPTARSDFDGWRSLISDSVVIGRPHGWRCGC
jgi:hypothetical protein